MKCYAKRHALASDAMNAAQLVTKQLLEEQSDRIAARCYNEVWCAMLQHHGFAVTRIPTRDSARLWFALRILVVGLAVLVRVSTALSPRLAFSIPNPSICARTWLV